MYIPELSQIFFNVNNFNKYGNYACTFISYIYINILFEGCIKVSMYIFLIKPRMDILFTPTKLWARKSKTMGCS